MCNGVLSSNFGKHKYFGMKFFLAFLVFFNVAGYSQCKTYKLARNGDTLNCTDVNDRKQGKWIERREGLRGEAGYDAEGVYENDKRNGYWRLYTTMGDLYAVENYRWGNKNGLSQYFSITGLVREESWKAVNPDNPYDTIEVPDPVNPYKVEMKVVKLEGSTVKHGSWKYYDSKTGFIIKTENYILDKLEDAGKRMDRIVGEISVNDSSIIKKKLAGPKEKPKEVVDFEKKNKGKSIKVQDGRTYQ